MSARHFSVSELIAEVNLLLGQAFASLWVEGEVTNVSESSRGHLYFTLKDATAALDCVMWSSRASRLRFRIEDGLAAAAAGSLTVYPQRGRFQLVVDQLEPLGQGALQLAFEQLKARLAAEGLFDEARKRPLPALPQRVGIVTSPTGAALRDMLKILRRWPHLRVVVAPARVQGEGAAAEIATAVRRLAGSGLVDVLLVGRGGGSLEDLWAFNEEPVARALAESPVPVVAGVGHQVDFTIADFVADVRAATPTQAAELVVAQLEGALRRLVDGEVRLARDLQRHLALARTRLRGLAGSSGLARVPQRVRLLHARLERANRLVPALRRLVERRAARLVAAEAALRRVPAQAAAGGHRKLLVSREQQLRQLLARRLERVRDRVAGAQRSLVHLGPQQVLERGYSITTMAGDAAPLRDAGGVRPGQVLETTLARGRLRSVVGPAGPKPRGRRPPPAQGALDFGEDE